MAEIQALLDLHGAAYSYNSLWPIFFHDSLDKAGARDDEEFVSQPFREFLGLAHPASPAIYALNPFRCQLGGALRAANALRDEDKSLVNRGPGKLLVANIVAQAHAYIVNDGIICLDFILETGYLFRDIREKPIIHVFNIGSVISEPVSSPRIKAAACPGSKFTVPSPCLFQCG